MQKRLALATLLAVAAPAAALAQATPARDNIDALIEVQARANKVPAEFVHRVVKRESNYNARAKGGSALGLMQIKHATARGLGYQGDAAGLYDPETNLKYGIAYLAGAYRAAKGDLAQAYTYYNRGYYYAAKKLGITTDVADAGPTPAPAATSATAFTGLFGLRTGSADQGGALASSPALAYAAGATAVAVIDVPLPPRRPAALGGGDAVQVAASPEPAAIQAQAAVAPAAQQAAAPSTVASVAAEMVEVPLPPRRPSAILLAAAKRPVAVARKTDAPETVLEATALPSAQ